MKSTRLRFARKFRRCRLRFRATLVAAAYLSLSAISGRAVGIASTRVTPRKTRTVAIAPWVRSVSFKAAKRPKKRIVQGQHQDSRRVEPQETQQLILLQYAKRFCNAIRRPAEDADLDHCRETVSQEDEGRNSCRQANASPVESGGTENFWGWTADTFLISCRAGAREPGEVVRNSWQTGKVLQLDSPALECLRNWFIGTPLSARLEMRTFASLLTYKLPRLRSPQLAI